MTLQPYSSVLIVINIPDKVINQTTIKCTATLFTMTYNQHTQTLVLNWTIKCYANNAGAYGDYLGSFIPDYSKETIADNTTFVDPSTGVIVFPESNPDSTAAYMGQYDFFNMLAEKQPLKVHDIIRQYGYQVLNWDK